MVPSILLIDEEVYVRHILSYKLRREGFMTHLAADPTEACRIFDEKPMDLILMDIALPTPTEGFALARRMRQYNGGASDLPIIILSAHCSEADIRFSNEIAASGYITKPFSLSFVIRKIKSILPD